MSVKNIHVKFLEPTEYKQYQEFIGSNSHATFEHSLEWAKILNKNFKHKTKHLIAINEENHICGALALFDCKGFIQKRLVSTPYSIYSPIISDTEETKKALIEFAIKICKDLDFDFLQLREKTISPIFNKLKMQEQNNVFNMSLKLSHDIETTRMKLPKSSVRWGIKKAQNSNLSVGKGVAPMHLDQFYNLFLQTRKHRGVPAYPKEYFQDIINAFAINNSLGSKKTTSNSNVKIYISYHNEKPIAAIFLIFYKNEMRYFAAGATYQHELLAMQPYHLIMWQAIKDATEQGYQKFNLGGATTNTNDGGLLTFKKRWSDKIEEIPYYYYLNKTKEIPNTEESSTIQLASKIFQKLPTQIINFISPRIIKKFI